jgi:hypothetical protein
MADCCRHCVGTGHYRHPLGGSEICPWCCGTGGTLLIYGQAQTPPAQAQEWSDQFTVAEVPQ